MQAHRIESVVREDGSLIINNLPFHTGDLVEVIVLPRELSAEKHHDSPLRGTKIIYHDPFEGVAAGDWDAAR